MATGMLVTRLVEALMLGLVNRIIGAVFGVFTGMLIAMLLSFALLSFIPGGFGDYVGRSLTGRAAAGIIGSVTGIKPADSVKQPPVKPPPPDRLKDTI
ncbi:MAG: CvpA family protein, partial [Myxococcota bacterium]